MEPAIGQSACERILPQGQHFLSLYTCDGPGPRLIIKLDLVGQLIATASSVRMLSSAEYLDFQNLPAGSLIDVETKSRHYHIECLGGNAIRISGHPDYCPAPVLAHLEGSFDKENGLEWGFIGRGKRMVFRLSDDHPVTTSRVLRIHVDQPHLIQPKSSPRIQ